MWEKIQATFDDVAQLPLDQRSARLQEIAGNDHSLREEVESLLRHDHTDRDLPMVRRSGTIVLESTRSPGDLVTNYKLIYPLSINKFSEVWCAELLDPIHKTRRPKSKHS